METIRADIFPAKLTDGTTVLDPVKVLVGLDRAWVYKLDGREGTLLHEWLLDDLRGGLQKGYVLTVDGREIDVSRSTNCGCGSNKSWKPFPYRIVMSSLPPK
jgi:hypothetical protein